MDKPKYGLRMKQSGKILGFTVSSNEGGEFCGENTYELDELEDNMWLVDSEYQAAYVARYSTPWYNAGYETPKNPYKVEDLQVVKIEMMVEPIGIKAPEPREFFDMAYAHDPNHLLLIRKQLEEHPELYYLWYEWATILRKEGKIK